MRPLCDSHFNPNGILYLQFESEVEQLCYRLLELRFTSVTRLINVLNSLFQLLFKSCLLILAKDIEFGESHNEAEMMTDQR